MNLDIVEDCSLESYLSSECFKVGMNFNIIEYFTNNYRGPVSKFALDLATAQGSSSAVERLFSQASLLCSKKRMRMKNSRKTETIILKCLLIFFSENSGNSRNSF